MIKNISLAITFSFTLLLLGCSSTSPLPKSVNTSKKSQLTDQQRNEIAMVAFSMLSIKYNWGGKRPDFGLDCSGLVTNVFQKAVGFKISGAAKHMAQHGQTISTKDAFSNKLKAGDLLFFNTTGNSYSHVGIFIGEEKFLHASSGKGRVIISSIHNTYYKKRLELIKRI